VSRKTARKQSPQGSHLPFQALSGACLFHTVHLVREVIFHIQAHRLVIASLRGNKETMMGLWKKSERARVRASIAKAWGHKKFYRKSPRVDERMVEARRYIREWKRANPKRGG